MLLHLSHGFLLSGSNGRDFDYHPKSHIIHQQKSRHKVGAGYLVFCVQARSGRVSRFMALAPSVIAIFGAIRHGAGDGAWHYS
jgi:hypothetical protein